MTKKQLSTRLPGDRLYCSCRKNAKLTEFDVVATVIKNDPEKEQITIHRGIKYGTLDVRIGSKNKDGIITFDYDKIIEYYSPFHPAYKSLFQLQNSMPDTEDVLYRLDTLEEFLVEADNGCFYESASLWCLRNKIKDVTDIGSLFGFQAEFFLPNGIKYTGVDSLPDATILAPAATEDNSVCINNTVYPCELPHGAMAISALCVGFLCTGEEVYKKLSEQFEYLALDNEQEKELIEKYWTEIYREMESPYNREYRLSGDEDDVDDTTTTRIIVYKRKEV